MGNSEFEILEALKLILAKLENIERRIDLIDSEIKSYQQNTCSNLPPICTNDAVTEDVGMEAVVNPEPGMNAEPEADMCTDANETVESVMGFVEETESDSVMENVHNEDSRVENAEVFDNDNILGDNVVENAVVDDDALANAEIKADAFQEGEIQNQEGEIQNHEGEIQNQEIEDMDFASNKAEAVIDRMKPKLPSWKTDMPGYRIEDVNDGISLNDRIFLLTELFSGDAELFKETLSQINGSDDFEQFESYVCDKFPDWNMESEAVYRLMMLARRKLS